VHHWSGIFWVKKNRFFYTYSMYLIVITFEMIFVSGVLGNGGLVTSQLDNWTTGNWQLVNWTTGNWQLETGD
jgi:hypothetical protein